MAKFRTFSSSSSSSSSSGKKKMIKLNNIAEKLQKGLSIVRPRSSSSNDNNSVPNDVKQGHFAVIAVDGSGEATRFVVPLSCLSRRPFRRLLQMAAEEYGFDREGALTVPCGPIELQRILADDESLWQGYCNAMVQSY